MPQFILLLHETPAAFSAIAPEEMQTIIQRYVAWGARLREAGILADSHKLTGEPGQVMRGHAGQVRVTDGPYSEAKEVLGGYFTIVAASYDEAVERARDCPHLEYGGTIEVRQVDTMGQ
jgi:hypothetical protein